MKPSDQLPPARSRGFQPLANGFRTKCLRRKKALPPKQQRFFSIFDANAIALPMSLRLHRSLQVLAALAFLFCALGIVSTMVSLKYETEASNCISTVDGRDLCQALHYNWIGLGAAVVFIVALSFLKIKAIKPQK
ncbi:hypothetical protein [Hymenobacter daeguensis]